MFNDVAKSKLKLKPKKAKPYRTKPRPLGLRKSLGYDNVSELLTRIEGGRYR
jgi:hypothetical protein